MRTRSGVTTDANRRRSPTNNSKGRPESRFTTDRVFSSLVRSCRRGGVSGGPFREQGRRFLPEAHAATVLPGSHGLGAGALDRVERQQRPGRGALAATRFRSFDRQVHRLPDERAGIGKGHVRALQHEANRAGALHSAGPVGRAAWTGDATQSHGGDDPGRAGARRPSPGHVRSLGRYQRAARLAGAPSALPRR